MIASMEAMLASLGAAPGADAIACGTYCAVMHPLPVAGFLAATALVLAACGPATDPVPNATSPAALATSAAADARAGGPATSEPATSEPLTGPTPDASDPASVFTTTRAELMRVQAERGPRRALAQLERRIERIPALAGVCHAIAHELGQDAVARAGGDARAALEQGSEVCGGGFVHGVIETVLGDSKDPGRDLLRVCAPDNSGSCFHGVGHGVMFATGMDVPAALDLCDRSPSPELSNRCGEGVFMQLFSSDLSAQHVAGEETVDIARDPTRAQARCRTVRAHYAANCWFYVPTVYLTAHPDDFAAAMTWCRDSGTRVGRQLCARGVGSRAVKYHPDDLSVADATCSAAGALTDSCLQGMGSYWSVHHEGRVEPSDVCEQLDPSQLRKRCRAVV